MYVCFSPVFLFQSSGDESCVLAAVVNLAVDGGNVGEVGARARVLRVVGSLMSVRARVIIKGVANDTGTCILKENCCKVRWTIDLMERFSLRKWRSIYGHKSHKYYFANNCALLKRIIFYYCFFVNIFERTSRRELC